MEDAVAFRHRLRVRYAEVDSQQIVFNAHYLTYIDTALTEYFRAIGYDYSDYVAQTGADFHVVDAQLSFRQPSHFDDELDIEVRCARLGRTSIHYAFAIRGAGQEDVRVEGRLAHVHVGPDGRATPPDGAFLDRVLEASGGALADPRRPSPSRDATAFWDELYGRHQDTRYGVEPNDYLADQLSRLEPGRLLLPAEGEGRNAIWAMRQGWQVDGFDISEVALARARSLAAAHGVHPNLFQADMSLVELDEASFDAIALIYAHAPREVRRSAWPRFKRALRPGGVVIIEAFAPPHLELGSRCGPKTQDLLYDIDSLRQELEGLEVWRLGEERVTLNAGAHQGPGVVLRALAHKPVEQP